MPDEGSELVSEVFQRHAAGSLDLAAPTIWAYEVCNALRSAVRGGRLARADGQRYLLTLLDMDIEPIAFEPLATRAWELALTRGLTVYDASYIALAEARECDLYTCDAQLARAAEDLVTVHLLGGD